MKISARNILEGTVRHITHGAVNTEVVVDLTSGVSVTSIITKDSADRLGLAPGKKAYVVIKASDVMVAVD